MATGWTPGGAIPFIGSKMDVVMSLGAGVGNKREFWGLVAAQFGTVPIVGGEKLLVQASRSVSHNMSRQLQCGL